MTREIKFGRFQLIELVENRAGIETWRAEISTPKVQLPCVIKRADPSSATLESAQRAMREEARVAGLVRHPHLVELYESDEIDGVPFACFEQIQGTTLHALAQTSKLPLPIDAALEVGEQVSDVLFHIHHAGLVHGALSLSNIYVSESAGIKVIGFGVVYGRKSAANAAHLPVPPNIAYAAPEQTGDKPIDARADIFSLGLVLVELITGTPLLPDGSATQESIGDLIVSRCASQTTETIPEPVIQLLVQLTQTDLSARARAADFVTRACSQLSSQVNALRQFAQR